jgi:hypothetical protein
MFPPLVSDITLVCSSFLTSSLFFFFLHINANSPTNLQSDLFHVILPTHLHL